jgi:uncharacterized membrane protein YphA (DoxX/SURF4 family)
MAGVALIVLRCIVAMTVVVETYKHFAPGCSPVIDAFAVLVGLFLFLGFLTPYCAVLSCFVELAFFVGAGIQSGFQFGMSALTAACAAVLGPGAYSLDARFFGRKVIKIPPRRNS